MSGIWSILLTMYCKLKTLLASVFTVFLISCEQNTDVFSKLNKTLSIDHIKTNIQSSSADRSHLHGFEIILENKQVTLSQLINILSILAKEMENLPAVKHDYQNFLTQHQLHHSETLFHDYVRVKLIFEATRDGGWWHLKWQVTDQEPNSKQIWQQWQKYNESEWQLSTVTARAECDELSALFAFLTRKLGVKNLGLFWPRWNHVVAVWTIKQHDKDIRIVIPNSQVFLSKKASLGTTEFDPYTQKRIYEYTAKDVSSGFQLPSALVKQFILATRQHYHLPQEQLQKQRNYIAKKIRSLGFD